MEAAAVHEGADSYCRQTGLNEFVAASKFEGARIGFFFSTGARGLGYYRDWELAVRLARDYTGVAPLKAVVVDINRLLAVAPGDHHRHPNAPPAHRPPPVPQQARWARCTQAEAGALGVRTHAGRQRRASGHPSRARSRPSLVADGPHRGPGQRLAPQGRVVGH